MDKTIVHRRAASGNGNIRKKTVTSKGKQYTVWEGRITTGRNPGTGRQLQRSVSGKSQKEVREKLQAIAVELNNGTYREPTKMTLAQWLNIWLPLISAASSPEQWRSIPVIFGCISSPH
ncbi:MAG: hypothetical protein ACLUIW_06150 [Dysosmobacter welbionis]